MNNFREKEKLGLRGEVKVFCPQTGVLTRQPNCIVEMGRAFTLGHLLGKDITNSDSPIKYSEIPGRPSSKYGSSLASPYEYSLRWFGIGKAPGMISSASPTSVEINSEIFGDDTIGDEQNGALYIGAIDKFRENDSTTVILNDDEIPSGQTSSIIVDNAALDVIFLRFKLHVSTANIRLFTGLSTASYFLANELSLVSAPVSTSIPESKAEFENIFDPEENPPQAHMFSKLRFAVPLPFFGNMSYFIDYRIYA
jgi:hypothetical protein